MAELVDYNNKDIGFHYSTEEQWTGEYWIDGKKIYTKTFIGSFRWGDNLLTNVSTLIHAMGQGKIDDNIRLVPYFETDFLLYVEQQKESTDKVNIYITKNNTQYNATDCKIVVMYTKINE